MGKSSRDKRDIYYRMAKEQGWRARSAYKLIQIDEQFHIFQHPETRQPIKRVVDLCAAPGSWSQVLADRLWRPLDEEQRKEVKIVAIDLQEMAPLAGVKQIQGDITSVDTAQQVVNCFPLGQLAELIVCDGAPDVTGLHDLDEYIQSHLILAALTICARLLEPGGTFVAKVFRGRDAVSLLGPQLRCLFNRSVSFAKPRSSRNSSLEAFVVCQGYCGLRLKMNPSMTPASRDGRKKENEQTTNPLPWYNADNFDNLIDNHQAILPFVACGDLSGFDSDLTYALDDDHLVLPPVQPPLDPAYSEVCRHADKSHLNQARDNSDDVYGLKEVDALVDSILAGSIDVD